MTDDTSLLITQPFDYSQLPDTLALSLKDRAHRIRTTYEKAVLEIGRELTEAQDELAHHGDGTFQAWAQAELGLSRGSVYNLINVYKRFGVHPNFGRTKLSLGRSALYLLAQPSTPDAVIDDITQRLEAGEPITHQDVKTAVRKAKGPTEFQQRVGKRIIATLKEMGPLALTDLVKYAGYNEINIKAALRHLDQVTLQEAPDGAEVYWFAGKPFPSGDSEPEATDLADEPLDANGTPLAAYLSLSSDNFTREAAALPREHLQLLLDQERGFRSRSGVIKWLERQIAASPSAGLGLDPEDIRLVHDIPERQREMLLAVAAGQPVVKNAATRTALINRGLVHQHDPADGGWWDVIRLTEKGERAAVVLAQWIRNEALQSGLADGLSLTASGDPDFPATLTIDEPAEPSTPIPPHATEGPGEQSDPMGSGVSIPADADPDAALIRRIIDELTRGDKGLLDLSETLGVPPPQLGPVLHRLATVKPIQIYRYSPPGRGGRSLYSLTPDARTTLSTPTPPVGKNGPGVPDSADPEVEGALQVRRDLEGACVTLLKSIENFTRIKSITSLAALDADRLAETEKLLDQVYHRSTAARQHATGLIVQIRTQAPTPSDEAVTADG